MNRSISSSAQRIVIWSMYSLGFLPGRGEGRPFKEYAFASVKVGTQREGALVYGIVSTSMMFTECLFLDMNHSQFLLLVFPVILFGCGQEEELTIIDQYAVHEIVLEATGEYENPYTDLAVNVTFRNERGDSLFRPAFWDGDKRWKIRFSSPTGNTRWVYETRATNPEDAGLHGVTGTLRSTANRGEHTLRQHGLLQMSPGKRNVIHQDGTPFLLVGDTPWALPFRATDAQVEIYAAKRSGQGFNAALLMTVQPDMNAEGPDGRATDQGFARGFDDLSEGHLNQLRPEYFAYLDSITNTLLEHGIIPVYQPVFHGFGWKGLQVLGPKVVPEEYVRYCRYLLARYGAQPAIWLVSGDHDGKDPGVREAGSMLEREDAYQQPTGLHYNPCDDFVAEWAKQDTTKHCLHYNKSYQEDDWLDFQWAQTGHGQDHQYHKVSRMYDNLPTKAVANGEPTYEGMNDGENGLGWWQGEDAWGQLFSGGTMGVVYGAAGLWQWKVSEEEVGWTAWATQPKSWRTALNLSGAEYVGLMSKALEGVDMTDIRKLPAPAGLEFPLLVKPDKTYLAWLPQGGEVSLTGIPKGMRQRWFNAKTGDFKPAVANDGLFVSPDDSPWVLIISQVTN